VSRRQVSPGAAVIALRFPRLPSSHLPRLTLATLLAMRRSALVSRHPICSREVLDRLPLFVVIAAWEQRREGEFTCAEPANFASTCPNLEAPHFHDVTDRRFCWQMVSTVSIMPSVTFAVANPGAAGYRARPHCDFATGHRCGSLEKK
jgi:hypothetical protein